MFQSQTVNNMLKNKQIERNTIGESTSEVYKIYLLDGNRNGYLKYDLIKSDFGVNHEYEIIDFLSHQFQIAEVFYYEYPYLITFELEGEPSFLVEDKKTAIKIIAKALIKLHSIDITHCHLLSELKIKQNYPSDDLVFVHGDACLPNFLIHLDELSGIIDLGGAGIGDRYEDLSLVTWSILYNFNDFKYVHLFFEEYGQHYYNLEKILTFLKLQEMNLEDVIHYLPK